MALSGTITGKTDNEYIDVKVVWSATQSIANNSSTITATLYYQRNNSGYTTHGNFRGTLTINGQEFNEFKEIWITETNWADAITATVTVPHNSDGNKSVSISATGFVGSTSLHSTSLSGTITLDTIHRKAVITSAVNFNDEGNPTIKYSNPAGNTATTLQACISFTGAADDIAYRNISKTGNSYTFNLTTAERNVLRQATTGKSRTVRFYVKSVIGGVNNLSYIEKTLTITNANPTLNPNIEDNNETTIALTGDKYKLIKYYSNAVVISNAAAKKYATIKSQKITNGSRTLTANGTFNAVENAAFTFTVTDSRGYSTTQTINKNMVNYIKPTCDIGGGTPSASGDFNFNVKGNFFNGSFGAVSNTLNVYYRYKAEGGSYTAWAAMTVTKSGNTYTASKALTGLDYQTTYVFQAYAVDKLKTTYSVEKTIQSIPVFDWGKDDFNVNGTFKLKNRTVLRNNGDNNNIILSAEEATNGVFIRPNGTGDSTGQAIFNKNGDLSLSGGLSLGGGLSMSELTVGGRKYGTNKVLWSGAHFMDGGQTATLSEAVSKQPNGIVLVFSRHNGDTADNANFNHFFVSKQFVATHGGAGSTFMMATINFGLVCCKYLYISDTKITGNDLNYDAGTGSSGIKFDNQAYCLRYVIGV